MKKIFTKAYLLGSLMLMGQISFAQINIPDNSIIDMQSANCMTPTSYGPTSMVCEGNYLYVGYWSGTQTPDGKTRVETFDISSGTPVSVGVKDLSTKQSSVKDITLHNGKMYVTSRYAEKLYIVDYSDPKNLSVIGETDAIFNIPHEVEIEGNYAYVANIDGKSLDIIDISTPSKPTLTNKYNIGGFTHSLAVKGNYAYVVDQTKGIRILDISNVQQPVEKDTLLLPSAYEVELVGNYLYASGWVSAENAASIQVYDVTDPQKPVKGMTLSLAEIGVGNVRHLEYRDGYLLASCDPKSTSGSLTIIDLQNPSSPKIVGYTTNSSNRNSGATIASNGNIYTSSELQQKICSVVAPKPLPCITEQDVSIKQNTVACSESTDVEITNSQNDVMYYLRDDADDSVIGDGKKGDGSTLSFTTGKLSKDMTYNVYATKGTKNEYALNIVKQTTTKHGLRMSDNEPFMGWENLTVEAYIKPENIGTVQGIVTRRTYIGLEWELKIQADGKLLATTQSGGQYNTVKSSVAIKAGEWTHVAFSYATNGEMKIYLNGIDVTTEKTGAGTGKMWGSNLIFLSVGTSNMDNTDFIGSFDEVRVWNAVRTPSEIMDNKCKVDPTSAGLKVYYPISKGSGLSALDATGNGYNGAFIGLTENSWEATNTPCNGPDQLCMSEMKNTVSVKVDCITSTIEVAGIQLSIYPNPASTEINVSSNEILGTVVITNAQGVVVKTVSSSKRTEVISLDDLSNGVYYLKLSSGATAIIVIQ